MFDEDLEFMHWCLKQMCAPEITLDCFYRIKKVVKEAQKTPNNSASTKLADYLQRALVYLKSGEMARPERLIKSVISQLRSGS